MARHVGGRLVSRLSKASSSGIRVRVVILAGRVCTLLVVEGMSLAVRWVWWAWIVCCGNGGFAGPSRMRLEIHRRLIDLQWRHRSCEIDWRSPRDALATLTVYCLQMNIVGLNTAIPYLLGNPRCTARQDTVLTEPTNYCSQFGLLDKAGTSIPSRATHLDTRRNSKS